MYCLVDNLNMFRHLCLGLYIYNLLSFNGCLVLLYMSSFQTTLTPNPEKLYKYRSVTKQYETCVLNELFKTCASSGAGGLETVQIS